LLAPLDDYVGRSAFYVGDLDRKVSVLVDRFVRPGDTVLDIGANLGLITLRMAKRVGPAGTVHAFEPNPAMVERVKASIAKSEITNVVLHEVALGDVAGTLPLAVPAGNAGMASLVSNRVQPKTCVEVPVIRLDDIDVGQVSFVKIDVEGFEEQVLRGFASTLGERPPHVILFEQNDERGAPIPYLKEAGYKLYGVPKALLRLRLQQVEQWNLAFNDYVAISGRLSEDGRDRLAQLT